MAVLLRDVAGLSYTEIADSLEITLATVKWRIYKGREEIALALAREGITFGTQTQPVKAEELLEPARVRSGEQSAPEGRRDLVRVHRRDRPLDRAPWQSRRLGEPDGGQHRQPLLRRTRRGAAR